MLDPEKGTGNSAHTPCWTLNPEEGTVLKPVFCVDAENVCFQDLNRPSSGSNIGFVSVSGAKTPPLEGKNRFWTPCLGRGPVLTPMSLSQFFA